MQLLGHRHDCGIGVEISSLPPGVRAETFTYANGKQVTIYRAPFVSEGPCLLVEGNQQVLYYMYASYVFRWPKGAVQLDLGHGSIRRHMGVRTGVPITGRWAPETLTAFALAWVRARG